MNRPIFLTRTQRVLPAARRLLAAVIVLGFFIGLGLLLGAKVSS